MKQKSSTKKGPGYSLKPDGAFLIENYNQARPFSNFFPGIAGVWGVPMWVFYVNRGQAIASFGIESKDKSILEFQPANKAYRLASQQGFRTFLKIKSGAKTIFYEPFQNNGVDPRIRQTMSITSHDLTLEETNETLGLKIAVNYFTLPEEPYSALVRRVTITNISRKPLSVELIDGLPVINPYGTTDWLLKNMARTVEAWVNVNNLTRRAPYYHLKVVVNDRPAVEHITEGNFYFAFSNEGKSAKLLEPIVEAACVFGENNDFKTPENFWQTGSFKIPKKQQTANRMPSAMSHAQFRLVPKENREIVSLAGYAHDENELNRLVTRVTQKDFIKHKAERNKEIIDEIKNFAFTNSSSREFNLYSGQNFLDNILRGGLPVSLKIGDGTIAFNVYSRKHGDPERDYNQFVLAPTYFSQGNGNYRDVNQNRRNDGWFNPHVKDSTISTFLNLSQADGYNPLVVKGLSFFLDDVRIDEILKQYVHEGGEDRLRKLLKQGFQPGELLRTVLLHNIRLKVSPQEFLAKVLEHCHKNEQSDHGEGFWTDHWTYNLDLLDSYLSLYPEELENLLLNKKHFCFHHSHFYVLPREDRYVLTPRGVRQYHSVADGAKEIKVAHGAKLRVRNGQGPVYITNLLVKLLCLVVNKAATLDPSGIGVEMEAEKPNWYDALNGLPGLTGSSISETCELKRLCLFILNAVNTLGLNEHFQVGIFEELAEFIMGLNQELSAKSEPLMFWDKANQLKEQYRLRIRQGIDGREKDVFAQEIREFLNAVINKVDRGIRLAQEKNSLTTYFYHEVTQYKVLDKRHGGFTSVKPLAFKRHELPLFLEGFVHALRMEGKEGQKLFGQVRKSPLFDRKLKMYKVNADLSKESEEIGRTRIFPRGWLENESIWLHMEYKWMLELLRAGLHEEFFNDLRNVLVPFMDAKKYGRSILENSSFLASSAHEDTKLHGQGFVARLSGSTAEFLNAWLWMNAGVKPFQMKKNELTLSLAPILPGWLFTRQTTTINFRGQGRQWETFKLPSNTYAFNFMGALTVYHNPKRKDTFGPRKAVVKNISLVYPGQAQPVNISSAVIPQEHAQNIREHKLERIDVYLE